jgi:amino acid transporter
MIRTHDQIFLEKRKKLNRLWPIVGTALIVTLVLLYILLFIRTPKLVNPYLVMELIKTDQMAESSLHLLALICPIAIIFLFLTVGAVILFGFGCYKTEKRYLRILEGSQ